MSRIVSRDGNVIAADFRPRASNPRAPMEIEIRSDLLYCDALACLVRHTLLVNGRVIQLGHAVRAKPTQ